MTKKGRLTLVVNGESLSVQEIVTKYAEVAIKQLGGNSQKKRSNYKYKNTELKVPYKFFFFFFGALIMQLWASTFPVWAATS